MEGPGRASARPQAASSRTRPPDRTTTYGKVAEAAAQARRRRRTSTLKDPKDWTIAGKPLKRLDTPDKLTGKQVYGIDVKLPGMLNAAIKDCPVFGGKVKSFDAAKIKGMPGVKKVVQVGDTAVAVVADTWWRAKTALDALPIEWDDGPNANVSSATHRRDAEGRARPPNRPSSATRRRRQGRARGRREEGRGGLRLSVPEPRAHGADERHGAVDGRASARSGRRPRTARRRWRRRRRRRACRSTSATSTRCTSAAASAGARTQRVRAPSRAASPSRCRARRSSSSGRAKRTCRTACYHPITQCKLAGALDTDNNLTALQMRISGQSILAGGAAASAAERPGSGRLPGPQPGGAEGAFGYTVPNMLIDHCDAQPARPAGLLARREQQPERHLSRMLHGRARARGRAGPARVPAQADGEPSQASRACSTRWRSSVGWGKPAPQGVFRGLAQQHGLWQLCRRLRRGLGQRRQQGEDPPHRRGDRLRPCGQSRRRSSAQIEGSFVYGLSRPALRRDHHQGRRASSRRTSTPTIRCASPRCRRSRRSSCRPAASGAASASRPSSSRRLRC